jgi:hypothetical protein
MGLGGGQLGLSTNKKEIAILLACSTRNQDKKDGAGIINI